MCAERESQGPKLPKQIIFGSSLSFVVWKQSVFKKFTIVFKRKAGEELGAGAPLWLKIFSSGGF
jgi:hypothetical protein